MDEVQNFLKNFFENTQKNSLLESNIDIKHNLTNNKFIAILKSLFSEITNTNFDLQKLENAHQKLINNDIDNKYKNNFYYFIVEMINNFTGINFKNIQLDFIQSNNCIKFETFHELIKLFIKSDSCFLKNNQPSGYITNLLTSNNQTIEKINLEKNKIYIIIQSIIYALETKQSISEQINLETKRSISNQIADQILNLEIELSLSENIMFDLLSIPIPSEIFKIKLSINNKFESYILQNPTIKFKFLLNQEKLATGEEIKKKELTLYSEKALFSTESLFTSQLKQDLRRQYYKILNHTQYKNIIQYQVTANKLWIKIKVIDFLISNSGKKLQDISLYANLTIDEIETIYNYKNSTHSIHIGNLILIRLIKITEQQELEKLKSCKGKNELLNFFNDYTLELYTKVSLQEELNIKLEAQDQIFLEMKSTELPINDYINKFDVALDSLSKFKPNEFKKNNLDLAKALHYKIEDYFCLKLQYCKIIKLFMIIESFKQFTQDLEKIKHEVSLENYKKEIESFFKFLDKRFEELDNLTLDKNQKKTINKIIQETSSLNQHFKEITQSYQTNNSTYKLKFITNSTKNGLKDISNSFQIACNNKILSVDQLKTNNSYLNKLNNFSEEVQDLSLKVTEKMSEEKNIKEREDSKLNNKQRFNKTKKILPYILIPLTFIALEIAVIYCLDKFCKIEFKPTIILIISIAALAISLIIAHIIHKEWQESNQEEKKEINDIKNEPSSNFLYDSYKNIKKSYSFYETLKNFF